MTQLTLSDQQQVQVLQYVRQTSSFYDNQLVSHRDKLLNIYSSFTTFFQEKRANWQTTFKVNKAHEVVNKILPRIMARNPQWIVSFRTDEFDEEDKMLTSEQRAAKLEALSTLTVAIQDYLTYTFDKEGLREVMRLWAKSMIVYGNAFAVVRYKYDMSREYENVQEREFDEDGVEIITPRKKVKEKVVSEYPTIEMVSWSDILYDPRYVRMEDWPAVIRLKRGIRLSEFTQNRSKFMNIDKLESICNIAYEQGQDLRGYKQSIYAVTGIFDDGRTEPIDKNNFTVKYFQGYFEFEDENGEKNGENEKLYEFITVDDLIVIGAREITQISYEGIKCFEDPETYFATGFVEPILGLQEELNFKKNAASTAINQGINREWIWSPNSGVNPRDLISKPGNIIATSKDAQTALANLVELPFRNISADYFQEQNDFERQIQSMTFTVDTSNQRNEQALTNTATGIRVKFFETNSVIDEIRKHFEEGMERLAYKLLQCAYENMDNNIVVKKLNDQGYWELNKEALRDALRRYSIKVEVGTSSFDSVEQRREDAIAFYNLLAQASAQGVPVDMVEGLKEVIRTFEKKDENKFIKQSDPMMAQIQQQMGGQQQLQNPATTPSGPAELTSQVAGGQSLLANAP